MRRALPSSLCRQRLSTARGWCGTTIRSLSSSTFPSNSHPDKEMPDSLQLPSSFQSSSSGGSGIAPLAIDMVDPAVIASYPNAATHLTDAEISLFSDIKPTPVSLRQILETTDPYEAAQFLHSEFPVRCAERIRMIESIPTSSWVEVPELVEAHGRHVLAFWKLRSVSLDQEQVGEGLEEFTEAVREIVKENADMTSLISKGMTDLYRNCDEETIDASYIDGFLNTFLLNRLGSNVLMKQFLAVASPAEFGVVAGASYEQEGSRTGIVDPNCDVVRLCRQTAREVAKMVREQTDRSPPPITVEAYSASEDDLSHNGMRSSPTFSYIPPALGYILRELLKNSCRATVDACATLAHGEIRRRPVSVTVSADETRMMICVADRGGGIPFDRLQNVWSYLHSTTRMKSWRDEEMAACDADDSITSSATGIDHHHPSNPSELAGYGIGLPMSRLYARYLGGDLNLISMPGYGTHAYVFLPRLSTDQVETFSDRHEYVGTALAKASTQHGSSRGDFVL
mmetsp:Transcript_20622/g.45053  ORF Transcript_20622/g.45053 Transcript_20622/m.45053 type:complete len:512 (+) Transcript_20622:98-1633(+)